MFWKKVAARRFKNRFEVHIIQLNCVALYFALSLSLSVYIHFN